MRELKEHLVDVWYAKVEIKVGDSIVQKIDTALSASDWLLLVLSKNSILSEWVKLELNAAVVQTVRRGAYLLVARIDPVEIPPILADRKYADFVGDRRRGLNELLAVLSPGAAHYTDEESQKAWAGLSVIAGALLQNPNLDKKTIGELLEPMKDQWGMNDGAFSLYIDLCMQHRSLLHEVEFIRHLQSLDKDDPRMHEAIRYLLNNLTRDH